MEVIKLKIPDVVRAIGVLGTSLKRELFLCSLRAQMSNTMWKRVL